jgi:MFS family permease
VTIGDTSEAGRRTAGGTGVWSKERRTVTVGVALAVTVVAFEALSVATILPIVSRHLGDLRLYGWVFSAFLLSSLLGIVVAGSLADRVRLVVPMISGLALFACGLLIGGLAPDMPTLVAARAVQGLGAGAVPAVAYVAISRGYPDALRPRMFAVLSTAWVVPGLVGPVAAAFVATTVGWRWVFLGLLPLVVVAGVLAAIALRDVAAPRRRVPATLPYLGVLGVIGGGALALGSLTVVDRAPAAAAGLVVGAALLLVSLRRITPPGTLVAAPGLPATILSRGLTTCFFYAGDAYVPYALTVVRHAPTSLSAFALMASTVTWTAGSWTQARLVRRVGPRRLARTGEAVALVGLALLGLALLPSLPSWLGVVAWGVAGIGMGLAYAPMSLATLDAAAEGEEGAATASLQICDVLGQSIGTGAAGALVAVTAAAVGHRVGVGVAFAFGGAVGLGAIAVSRGIPRRLREGPAAPAVADRQASHATGSVGSGTLAEGRGPGDGRRHPRHVAQGLIDHDARVCGEAESAADLH